MITRICAAMQILNISTTCFTRSREITSVTYAIMSLPKILEPKTRYHIHSNYLGKLG